MRYHETQSIDEFSYGVSVDDIQTKFKKYKAFYAVATDQGLIGD